MIPQPIPSVLPTKAVLQTSNLSPIKRELPVDKTVFNAKEFTEPVVMSRPPNADVAKGGKVTSQAVSTPQEKKESIEAAKPMRQVPPPPARPNISMGNLSDSKFLFSTTSELVIDMNYQKSRCSRETRDAVKTQTGACTTPSKYATHYHSYLY